MPKPRFTGERMSRTTGNSRATMSALPSADPLSRTLTRTSTSRVAALAASTDRRQSRSSSRVP
jgi:hypothetical protein